MDETNKVKDESRDEKYFIIAPRLVLYLSRSPYDYTLWNVIKDIAGDSRECYIGTPDLAKLAMMSTGKASESRKFLIDHHLLGGKIRRDPGYPQPVWHLWIPDLWPANMRWCSENASIASRLEWRDQQLSPGESSKNEELSPGERGTTPGERGTTPHEKGTTPGETKNINKEDSFLNKKEEPSEINKIWNMIDQQLSLQAPPANTGAYISYNTYIKPLEPVSFTDHTLVVAAPNEPIRAYVDSRYGMTIKRLLCGALIGDYSVQFVINERKGS